jgi:glucose-1-phosphate cytidylyltransferase
VKVVLFCGGLGLRMGGNFGAVPKPMITIGERPILWHIMKYYASFGYCDFVLCLGYKAEVVKEYFLNYNEALSNDFVLSDGGRRLELLQTDTEDWSMTFVNTGIHSTIAERLRRVEPYLGDEDLFLANYGDVLTDAPLPDMVETLTERGKTALFLCAHPTHSFHVVSLDEQESVRGITEVTTSGIWINAGYFVLRRRIFDHLDGVEDLVGDAFARLIPDDELVAYPYEGFWAPMDTLKEREALETLLESGRAPWQRTGKATPPSSVSHA